MISIGEGGAIRSSGYIVSRYGRNELEFVLFSWDTCEPKAYAVLNLDTRDIDYDVDLMPVGIKKAANIVFMVGSNTFSVGKQSPLIHNAFTTGLMPNFGLAKTCHTCAHCNEGQSPNGHFAHCGFDESNTFSILDTNETTCGNHAYGSHRLET
jgi:hypothetical protein